MFQIIYIEEAIAEHPRTLELLERYKDANTIICKHYNEIFNRKAQNFRLQKKYPALILAEKQQGHVLPTPAEYGVGAKHNYYFSHMLNCLYDCRYCFLQGMYRSANYVLFINYESFTDAMDKIVANQSEEEIHFFSGYDCDSLAMEPVTGFYDFIYPYFAKSSNILLELRTKSTQIRKLLKTEPIDNIVTAFSFTPNEISQALEYKVPSLENRINAMQKLQEHGWNVGLRFDPLIYVDNFESLYQQLFEAVFSNLNTEQIHSISLGSFRLPKDYFKTIQQLYPKEPLFSQNFVDSNTQDMQGMVSYEYKKQVELHEFCESVILQHIPPNKYFPCHSIVEMNSTTNQSSHLN